MISILSISGREILDSELAVAINSTCNGRIRDMRERKCKRVYVCVRERERDTHRTERQSEREGKIADPLYCACIFSSVCV